MSDAIRIAVTAGPRNWPLVAKRRLQIGDSIYNRGCELPIKDLSADAIARLIDTGSAGWQMPTNAKRVVEPVPMPKTPAPRPRPAVVLVEDRRSPIDAWHLTLDANARVFGDRALAMDALMADERGRGLYLLASKEAGRSL
jgi:hypothetical protein